jgi:hypothetical protein
MTALAVVLVSGIAVLGAAVLVVRMLRSFDRLRPPADSDEDERQLHERFRQSRRRSDEQRRAVEEARARAAKRDS